MSNRLDPATRDALWLRYHAIAHDHANGLYVPILWHLALRGDSDAMISLADTFERPGRYSDGFSQAGLCYRAWRAGYAYGAQHLAMVAFNRGDMVGYRLWLNRAGRAGDADSARQHRRFETRLPHEAARRIRRKRPLRRYDLE